MFTRNFDIMQLVMNMNLTDSASVTVTSNGTVCPDYVNGNNYNVLKLTVNQNFTTSSTPYFTTCKASSTGTTYTSILSISTTTTSSATNTAIIDQSGNLSSGTTSEICGFGTNSAAESYNDFRIDAISGNSTNGLYFNSTNSKMTFTTENGKRYMNIHIEATNKTGSDISISEFGMWRKIPTYLTSTSSSYTGYALVYRKVFATTTIQANALFTFDDKAEIKDFSREYTLGDSCVLTRNYYKMLNWFTYKRDNYGSGYTTAPTDAQWSSSDDYSCLKALGTTGYQTGVNGFRYQWIGKYNTIYGSSNYTYYTGVLSNDFRLVVGNQSNLPTFDDCDLGERLVRYRTDGYSGLASWDNYQYSLSFGSVTKSVSNGVMTITMPYTITNTSASNITIREYGLYSYYGTKSQYYTYFLCLRGILPSDVVLEPNANTTITLTFSIPIRPNEPTT